MSVISIAFTFFLIMNSLGLVPLILSLLKDETPKERRRVIIREMLIALVIILAFNFLGEVFFTWLNISESNIQMAGGLILFLIAIRMIFPGPKKMEHPEEPIEKPFVVPIATPLVAGPSLLASVMFYARQEQSILVMIYAILIAWSATLIIFLSSPLLKRVLTDKGLTALQRLMGLILTLIAVQMFLQGIARFITNTIQ